jgi:heat shock protein HslJ
MTVILALAALLSLSGSEWGPAGGGEQSLQFRDSRVAGHSGCNRYIGSYEQDGNKLTFGPIAATKMACTPERMEKERAWIDMLARVRAFEATHLVLTLKGADGRTIATLQRRDFD